jgi:2-C-methyl-D-erythritol 2,4-cyclodiphosphate synthase
MFRTGLGYDSHRFDPDRTLVLGGVTIPDAPGLAGHSDADVALHAITDALLGAIGQDDIGELFPDTDPTLAGADSAQFVARAMELVADAGYTVANCDITILAEAPKLKPHKPAMRESVAAMLGVEPSAVAVKAKTNEQMGAIGRGEGLAALAAVLLCQKNAC